MSLVRLGKEAKAGTSSTLWVEEVDKYVIHEVTVTDPEALSEIGAVSHRRTGVADPPQADGSSAKGLMDLMAYQKFQACSRDVKRVQHPELKDTYRVTQEDEPLRRCLAGEHSTRLVLGVFPDDGRTGAFGAAAGPRLIQRYRTARDIARPRGIPSAEYV